MGVWWTTPRPGRFTLENDPVSIVQQAGWVAGPARNISSPPVFHPQTVQSAASRYTDGAIPAHPAGVW
jgi:hypothetical protein